MRFFAYFMLALVVATKKFIQRFFCLRNYKIRSRIPFLCDHIFRNRFDCLYYRHHQTYEKHGKWISKRGTSNVIKPTKTNRELPLYLKVRTAEFPWKPRLLLYHNNYDAPNITQTNHNTTQHAPKHPAEFNSANLPTFYLE